MSVILCFLFGHRLRFVLRALEGGKVFRCERCRLVLWKTPEGWRKLGKY
jgi:hypothetical protein